MSVRTSTERLPTFVSRQVTEARRFFLNLQPSHNSALEVVCGGVERTRHDYVVDRADFPYFAIEFVAEGEGSLTISDSQHKLTPGTLFAYGPNTRHTIRNDSRPGMRKYYLDIVGTRAQKLLRETGLHPHKRTFRPISIGAPHEMTELFEMFIRNAEQGGTYSAPICGSLVQLLSLKIRQLKLPDTNTLPQSYSTYEKIRQEIDERFLDFSTVRELANVCGVSSVYLSRLFHRFCDRGAYQYLMQRKMNYAAGLLMNEGLLVKEVAHRLRFKDAFQFSRAFKRVYGIPPKKLTST